MKKILIIGGDERMKAAREALETGFCVNTLGLYGGDCGDIEQSDVLLLPVPTTKDRETVYAPLSERKIRLDEIAEKAGGRLILCCNYMFEGKNCVDYGKLDGYSLLNAVPTAEGAIKLAIENTDFTLWQSRVLVIGFGRCGKVLADRLRALGARVTVSARKPSDFALCKASGLETANTGELCSVPLDYDIIFNTVDAGVIDRKALESCTARLMIDLSSKCGFSVDDALELGIKAFKAPGLPGVYAPRTAGKILAETVTELIHSHI